MLLPYKELRHCSILHVGVMHVSDNKPPVTSLLGKQPQETLSSEGSAGAAATTSQKQFNSKCCFSEIKILTKSELV